MSELKVKMMVMCFLNTKGNDPYEFVTSQQTVNETFYLQIL